MPTVVVASDLHLGITQASTLSALADRIASERPDLTILAGDIGERVENFVACLDLFKRLPGDVAVLAGNHDVWARRGNASEDLWARLLPEATRDAGMIWLEDTVWRQGDAAVAGSLAWYDYSARDDEVADLPAEYFIAHKGEYNIDARFVRWDWTDPEFADMLGTALCGRLDALERDESVRSVIVVTHVPLFDVQMSRKPGDRRWGISSAYFGNLTLGARILPYEKIQCVISGHTHIGREGTVARPDGAEIPVAVIPSDYGSPAYIAIRDGQPDEPVVIEGEAVWPQPH
jgi:predicted phosphohydrolase